MNEKDKKNYEAYVKEITPNHSLIKLMVRAFLCGGSICTLGQVFLQLFLGRGMEEDMAGAMVSFVLIGISAVLTGCNWYPSIVKWGGAGALVPITGFANSVTAPAIEYQTEGFVLGVGCKIFVIAGPVILYGIASSSALGFLYWLAQII